MSTTHALRYRIVVAILGGLAIALMSLAMESRMLPGQMLLASTDVATVPAAPATDAELLIDAHDCWTGNAPVDMAGQIPGHVVVTTANGVTRLGGARLVGQSLDQLFAGKAHGLTVHAFCR